MKTMILLAAASVFAVSCNPAKTQTTRVAHTASSSKPYPLDTCTVSGEKLGEMGAPYVINHEGQEVKFCCKNCLPKFEKDPAKYLAKLK